MQPRCRQTCLQHATTILDSGNATALPFSKFAAIVTFRTHKQQLAVFHVQLLKGKNLSYCPLCGETLKANAGSYKINSAVINALGAAQDADLNINAKRLKIGECLDAGLCCNTYKGEQPHLSARVCDVHFHACDDGCLGVWRAFALAGNCHHVTAQLQKSQQSSCDFPQRQHGSLLLVNSQDALSDCLTASVWLCSAVSSSPSVQLAGKLQHANRNAEPVCIKQIPLLGRNKRESRYGTCQYHMRKQAVESEVALQYGVCQQLQGHVMSVVGLSVCSNNMLQLVTELGDQSLLQVIEDGAALETFPSWVRVHTVCPPSF